MERRERKHRLAASARTIRGRLFQGMFLILTLCVLIFSAFSAITSLIGRQTAEISEKIAVLSWMSAAVDRSGSAIRDYALTGDLRYFKEYDQTISEFNAKLEQLSRFDSTAETAQRIISLSNLYTAYVNAYISFYSNYSSMYKYYSTDYYAYYEQGESIGGYIQSTLEEIREIEFQNSTEKYTDLIHNVQRFSIALLLLVLAVILAVILVSYRITRDIARPLAQLAGKTEEIARGNLELRPETPSDLHEIQVLSDAFTSMTTSIKQLLEKTHEQAQVEIMYREIRYQALLAQVNPHFLFNALTCVSQSALADGAAEAVEMISHISTVLRYSLNNLRQTVTLADELRNVDAYIYLQKMRLGSSLELSLRVDEAVDAAHTEFPWMILQPIVENCIVHGFASLPYTGVVDIQAAREGEQLRVTIHDNGCGIPADKLARITARTGSADGDHASIGLCNVRDRLADYYDGQAHCTIVSVPMEGTTVTIRAPIRPIGGAPV